MQPCSTEISLDCEVKKCERNEVRRNQHSIRCCHLPIPLTFRYIHFEFFQIRIFACLNCYYWELASRTPVKLSTQRKQVLQCNGLYARACYISCTTNRKGGLQFVLGCRNACAKALEACVNLTPL